MTGRFAPAFLLGDERCAAFVPQRYDSAEDRARAVVNAAERSVSPDVLACLEAQNHALTPSEARAAHLAALASPGSVCVVTGQQVGLFLGPLYTLYKAATAIVTARALQAETGRPAIPIFWLQSEDHDFAEVATTYVPRSGDEPLPLTASGAADSRVSMAHRAFGDDLPDVFRALTDALGRLPHADETVAQLQRHYSAGRGWVDAFAGLLGELFAAEGLLIFNPRTTAVAPLATSVHRRAVAQADTIADRLIARGQTLAEAGFGVPIHVRRGAPLSFFHPRGPDGPRFRLTPTDPEAPATDGEWTLVGAEQTVARSIIDAALDGAPGCLSTSALLRPVLQDSLLPTAAYVGGPGEIDYFAQIGPVYEAFGLPMPLLVPRHRFAVVEPKIQRGLDELSLDVATLARPQAELLDGVACRPRHLVDPVDLEARLLAAIRNEIGDLAPKLDELQPGLRKAAERTVDSVERACGKFVDKYRGALNQSDTRRVETIKKLKAALYPLGAPQERILSVPYFAARHGGQAFVRHVIERCRPYHTALEALTP